LSAYRQHQKGSASIPNQRFGTLGRVIRCPHCNQEFRLDKAIVSQLTEPVRFHLEEELRQAGERAEAKIAKLETELRRVSKDLVKTQRKTRTGSPTEEGYAPQDLFADVRRLPTCRVFSISATSWPWLIR
jgi:hypothetical protein